jgi:hypothetical protein
MNMQPGKIIASEELFRSEELLVRRVASFGGSVCYVTFDSYTDNRTLDRPGFGEAYLQARGIDAVHVLSRENRWYQHPELTDALAAVAAATAGYAKVIAYGSSMGGFAALHHGGACGATIGIALSPQYSVDPRIVPFDRRWAGDVEQIAFQDLEAAPPATQYVIYDPRDPYDRPHFELFAARSATLGIPVPHGGHPVASYLVEAGLLGPMLEAVEAGTFDPAAYRRELRRRRRQSAHYFFTLAQRVPPYRQRQKVALAELAVATRGENPVYHSHLAAALDAAGEHDAAYPVHQRAIAMSAETLHPLHNLLLHHEVRGELAQAHAIAEQLLGEHPAVSWLPLVRVRIRRRLRHRHWWGRLAYRLYLDPLLDRLFG